MRASIGHMSPDDRQSASLTHGAPLAPPAGGYGVVIDSQRPVHALRRSLLAQRLPSHSAKTGPASRTSVKTVASRTSEPASLAPASTKDGVTTDAQSRSANDATAITTREMAPRVEKKATIRTMFMQRASS